MVQSCLARTLAADTEQNPARDPYFFGLLDHRSSYGKYWFPEPLLNHEMDLDREFRVDWTHGEKAGRQDNGVRAEVEYSIGMLTIEAEVPYVNEREAVGFDAAGNRTVHERSEGIGSVELAARHPLVQFVSNDMSFDYTLAGALEVAVPTRTEVSRDTEIVPELFQLVRLGRHLSIQASVGLSYLIGAEEGGSQALEYGVTLGYTFDRQDVHVPGITSITPILEINGERGLNRGANGDNTLLGLAGARLDLKPVGAIQPRLGLGFITPLDAGGRDELRWGFITSLVFEY
jgi:hypothetical protein